MSGFSTQAIPLRGRQLIEASAGTGKTYTITNLYIRILLGRGIEAPLTVEKILVLTFTNAASAEINHRIRKRITEAKRVFKGGNTKDEFLVDLKNSSEDLEDDCKLLIAASQLMDNASIFTIHSFCARVLNELSLETGSLFNQSRDPSIDIALTQAAEDSFRRIILGLPSLEQRLALKIWPNPSDLAKSMKPFIFRTKVVFEPPEQNISDELEKITQITRDVKHLWIESNIAKKLSQAGLRKNSKQLTRLEAVARLCEEEDDLGIDHEMWEIYNTDALSARLTKGGELPEHGIFSLIDKVWDARKLVKQIKINLWHRLLASMKTLITDIKIRTNELSPDDLLSELWAAISESEQIPKLLVKRWPIALIDEFQDTDNLQYDIFSKVYGPEGSSCLLFIGDPKQAIYQFRSADIYTYLNAKQSANKIHNLSTNWRASQHLIEAINYLFSQKQIFGQTEINYVANDSPDQSSKMAVEIEKKTPAPFQIRLFEAEKPLTKLLARERCMADTAETVVHLLNAAANEVATINQKPINAGQIAILVRDRSDATAAQKALSRRGIKSVYVTQESILAQQTTQDLISVMEAILDPSNERLINTALSTRLLNVSAKEIDYLYQHSDARQRLYAEFRGYQEVWNAQGVALMIQNLIKQRQLAERWLNRPDGERQLTNLRHLSELLQRRSLAAPCGMLLLLTWLRREKIGSELSSNEDYQIRLESDENLVKITTIHASKGLEYDIVMLPLATFKSQQGTSEPALFHQKDSYGYIARLNFQPDEQVLGRARQEKYEEDMRLLYVAITRARYLVYLGIPVVKNIAETAVGKLLQIGEDEESIVGSVESKLPKKLFQVSSIRDSPITVRFEKADTAVLRKPPTIPTIKDDWLIHSYTGITKQLNRDDEAYEELSAVGYADDEQSTHISSKESIVDPFTFPRGRHIGIALHSLLEEIEFSSHEENIEIICRRYAIRLGLSQEQCEGVLIKWIHNILRTSLGHGFSLSDISSKDRISEMEFHFPFVMNNAFLDVAKKAGYLENTKNEEKINLYGVMTGLIDLIVRFDEKYFLIDYKSNFVGNTFNDYTQDKLRKTITENRYDLQYLIYSLALHRYLKARISSYNYESNFGGVKYLFLRGMQGPEDNTTGIFFDLPPAQLIEELDVIVRADIQ